MFMKIVPMPCKGITESLDRQSRSLAFKPSSVLDNLYNQSVSESNCDNNQLALYCYDFIIISFSTSSDFINTQLGSGILILV